MAQTAAGSNAYFVIVGARDNPMYEVEFGPLSRQFLQQQQQLQQQQAGGQQGGPQVTDQLDECFFFFLKLCWVCWVGVVGGLGGSRRTITDISISLWCTRRWT